ncbi:MAG TPA: 4a-hydroxytetrahydrobiopterin dehydratase [Candidatus Dormibacteraeota bacterium]|jgi:4a-hydroxytetrahydrobiopterin dehydratase
MIAEVSRMAERTVLDPADVSERVRRSNGWRLEGAELVKPYKFKNFVEAVDFVNAITGVAERQNHHPDLVVRWGEVTVRLTTHDAHGITENDFKLAEAIDRI